jgi:hypothetical protein
LEVTCWLEMVGMAVIKLFFQYKDHISGQKTKQIWLISHFIINISPHFYHPISQSMHRRGQNVIKASKFWSLWIAAEFQVMIWCWVNIAKMLKYCKNRKIYTKKHKTRQEIKFKSKNSIRRHRKQSFKPPVNNQN